MFLQFLNALSMFQRIMISIILACAIGIAILSLPQTQIRLPVLGVNLPEETQQLAKNLQKIQHYAQDQQQAVGLHITPQGYQFMVRAAASQQGNATTASSDLIWQPLQIAKLKTGSTFGADVSVSLSLLGEQQNDEEARLGRSQPMWFDLDDELASKTPQIVILPSGEITPFSLALTEKNKPADSRALHINEAGQITLSAPPTNQHPS